MGAARRGQSLPFIDGASMQRKILAPPVVDRGSRFAPLVKAQRVASAVAPATFGSDPARVATSACPSVAHNAVRDADEFHGLDTRDHQYGNDHRAPYRFRAILEPFTRVSDCERLLNGRSAREFYSNAPRSVAISRWTDGKRAVAVRRLSPNVGTEGRGA
jgi:hypothetical protein